MDRFLILGGLVVVSLSLVTAGRFRYPVKPGSALDKFFVWFQLAGNVLSVIIATCLPSVTGFRGLPWLSYAAAALVVSALAFYPVKLPALGGLRAPTNAKRSVKAPELRRTRWPYQTLFASGYLALLAYILSVFKFYF